jgi:SAM-dependent methyltransferase
MLPRHSFDALLVRNAYHEFTAHKSMLRHMRKALKPGGRLVLAEYVDADVIDEDRSAQVDEHRLAMRYARAELKDAGFTVAETVDNVHEERTDDYRAWTPATAYRVWMRQTDARMWMIVARRP